MAAGKPRGGLTRECETSKEILAMSAQTKSGCTQSLRDHLVPRNSEVACSQIGNLILEFELPEHAHRTFGPLLQSIEIHTIHSVELQVLTVVIEIIFIRCIERHEEIHI